MKRLTFIGIAVMLVSICFATEANAQKFSKVVTDADRWDAVTLTASSECAGGPQECALDVLKDMNISVGDTPDFSVYRLGDVNGRDVTVVFVSHLPDEDDSVLGMLYRVELTLTDAADRSFSVEALGRMYQCLDGAVGWRTTACQ